MDAIFLDTPERTRYSRYAKATFRKERRLIFDCRAKTEAIQKRALAEGLSYQTLIASLLHKYASGRQRSVTGDWPQA
jgi:predicted DNA binding CopG/RHH family protein